jgi:hypothetical protein
MKVCEIVIYASAIIGGSEGIPRPIDQAEELNT